MTYRFVGAEKGLEPLPGIPLEAEDAEFEAAVKAMPDLTLKQVMDTGLYVKDAPPASRKAN